MRFAGLILILLGLLSSLQANVFVVIYATVDGKTGHCGIAVDEYSVYVKDLVVNGITTYKLDSVKTGALLYYDLWPENDEYKGNYEGDVAPRYYKLPSSHYRQLISVRTLLDQGVPHKFEAPCDGLLSFTCTSKTDFETKVLLDKLFNRNKDFNAMHYNCGDFVLEGLMPVTGELIYAKEFVIRSHITTPNQLYKTLSIRPDITVLKNPGDKINGSFVQERVIKRMLLPALSFFQLMIPIPF